MIINIENLSIYSEDRIGIIGVNGVRKITLLNILSQRLETNNWMNNWMERLFWI